MSETKETQITGTLPENITDARVQNLESGALKFHIDFVSGQQLYVAAKKWAESDPNVKRIVMRGGGNNQLAIDFLYQRTSPKDSQGRTLERAFKKFFDKELGDGALMGWDYTDGAAVIK